MRILPWPNASRMAFSIRDDDVSFFSSPERLEVLYEDAFDKGFTISFSIIPMHKATTDLNVPPIYRGKNLYYAVNGNVALVNYLIRLINKKQADIVQHGYSHDGSSRRPELLMYNEKIGKFLREGRLLLEKTFNTQVLVFVPPWEFLTKNIMNEILKMGMSLSMSPLNFILLSHPLNFKSLKKFREVLFFTITKRGFFPIEVMEFNGIINIGALYNHVASQYKSIYLARRSFKNFKKILQEVYARNGCFVISTHNWQYFHDWKESITNSLLKKYLEKILKEINSKEFIWKAGLNEIIERITKIKAIKLKNEENEVEISTFKKIHGLTIRLFHDEEIIEQPPASYCFEIEHNCFRDIVFNMDVNQKLRIKKRK